MKVSMGKGTMTTEHKKDNVVTKQTAEVDFGASDFTKEPRPVVVTFERKIQPAMYESMGVSVTMPMNVSPEDYGELKKHLTELRNFVEDFLRESCSGAAPGTQKPAVATQSAKTVSSTASFEDELASLDNLNL